MTTLLDPINVTPQHPVIPSFRTARSDAPDTEAKLPKVNISVADGPKGEREDRANKSTFLPVTHCQPKRLTGRYRRTALRAIGYADICPGYLDQV